MRGYATLATALALLSGAAASAAAAQIKLEHGVNRGGDQYYKQFHATSAQACAAVCSNDASCKAMVWSQASKRCRLQNYVHTPTMNVCCVSGVKAEAARPQPWHACYGGTESPRASLRFVNRGGQPLRLLVNGRRLRDVGPHGQNAERHVLPPGRNMIQIVLPGGQYMTKHVIVVNKGAQTCWSWATVSYP